MFRGNLLSDNYNQLLSQVLRLAFEIPLSFPVAVDAGFLLPKSIGDQPDFEVWRHGTKLARQDYAPRTSLRRASFDGGFRHPCHVDNRESLQTLRKWKFSWVEK